MPYKSAAKRRAYQKKWQAQQRKEGRRAKDIELEEEFNRKKELGPTRKDVKSAKSQAQLKDADDEKSATQMLLDMRWVYRNVRGRRKLRDLVEGDKKEFIFLVKELMKIEGAILSAKIKKDGATGNETNNSFFVILKGLEDDVKKERSNVIDLKQIEHIMEPESVPYEGGEDGDAGVQGGEVLFRGNAPVEGPHR